MTNNKEIKKTITIKEVLSNDSYIIPIYQRNYEWEQPQIDRLIRDVNSIEENERYYLGTLVTFKRDDGSYELVDGQQRHTTLNLIKAVLDKKTFFNLKFQARSECELFFRVLSKGIDSPPEIPKTENLKQGVEIIESVFNEILPTDENKRNFRNKFLQQTYIFRTELPKETELNHYFEIMNNRGEQLEKHEILKAQLMNEIKDDKDREVFAQVWEACSFMGDYIWNNGLPKELLEKEEFSFDDIVSSLGKDKSSKNNQHQTIVALLERGVETLPEGFKQGEESKTYDYRSVLEFPTFLLYIYDLIKPDKKISFDDKKLLETFKDYKDAETFIVALLKYRIYFDKYIIKNKLSNDKESNWGIRGYEFEKEGVETKETAFENTIEEKKIEMLQAMFHYATISNDKKNWLLRLLKDKVEENDLYSVLKSELELELEEEFKDISLEEISFWSVSTKIFYYFEYMLWEVYYDYVKGEDKVDSPEEINSLVRKIKEVKSLFSNFYFRQLSSKEHLLPQNKISTIEVDKTLPPDKQDEEREKILHSFGNLCLISSSENSSANKEHPEYKKKSFYNNTSLKRLMMFETFSGNKWNVQEIKQHQEEMKNLLNFYKHLEE
ncbi:GmrSD restriction endonuclease domain-containing protein [Capnocytophaga leadbetteri]